MLISKTALYCLVSEGRLTLQIPGYSVDGAPQDLINIPDDWVCYLKSDGYSIGKTGYMHFTKKGFEACREDLEKAFEAAPEKRGCTWQDFIVHSEEHFTKVETRRQKDIAKLKAQLELLESMAQ
jgi:hypothetical protein